MIEDIVEWNGVLAAGGPLPCSSSQNGIRSPKAGHPHHKGRALSISKRFTTRRVDGELPPGTLLRRMGRYGAANSTLRLRGFFGLVMLDVFAIIVGFATASFLRLGVTDNLRWLLFAGTVIPIHIFVGMNTGAYTIAVLKEPFFAVKKGDQTLLIAVVTSIVLIFFLKVSETMPRLTIGIGTTTALFIIAVLRYLFIHHLPTIINGDPFNVVLIKDGDTAVPDGNFSLIIDAHDFFDPDSHDPIMYDRLANSLFFADRVVIACPVERRSAWTKALRGANIQSEIAMPELDEMAPIGVGPDRGTISLIVAVGPLGLYQRGLKRLFDLSIALTAGLVALPFMIAVAILIRLESPGPALFKQVRIGRGNRLFNLYKFRSMRVDRLDHAADRLVVRDDDRVTGVGRFIRRTSIDELPQLLQVIRGDMSIVGPRPHAMGARAAEKLYWEVDPRYWDRHATKPGLTGLAQVRGFRGNTLRENDLRDRLEADLEYLLHWSILKDIKIILLTIRVLVHRNAF